MKRKNKEVEFLRIECSRGPASVVGNSYEVDSTLASITEDGSQGQ